MPTDHRTIQAVVQMRLELERYVSAADRDLARQWSAAWQEVTDEVQSAAKALTEVAAEHGSWPARAAVLRHQRAQNALKITADAVSDLAKGAGVTIPQDLALIVQSSDRWQEAILRTQLPQVGVRLPWDRVSADALDAIVRRTRGRVESLTRPLPAHVQARMKSVLIRGVAVGDNPNAAAREIVRRCGAAFDGGLTRARNIARTELVDASREAALRSRKANADTLTGWRWHADLSARTCPSCLAQHGSLHPLDEPGPHDHQQGRCTAVPVAKTWRDLGIDLDEPGDDWPDAREWFDQQPPEVQERIMGKERLARLQDGRETWDNLSTRVSTAGWRDSHHVTPLGRKGTPINPGPTRGPAPAPVSPSVAKSISELTDTELEDEMAELMSDPDGFDNPRMDELAKEMDIRDARRQRAADAQARLDAEREEEEERERLGYGAGGKVWRRNKGNGERAIRDEYETFVELQYVQADQELNGVLLSAEGRLAASRGELDVRDLFTKKRRSLKRWASEELQEWMARNPRMSFPEFRSFAVNDDPGRAARSRFRDRGWESEFG